MTNPSYVVGIMTVAAVALRANVPRGLWGDEAISVSEARLGFFTMIHTLRVGDVQPPLYFSLLWVDIRLFGSGQLAARVPSIVAGTLMVPMAYLTAKACLDRKAGYIAALLATTAPLLVWYSQEARMYALYMLFALVAVWAQIRCVQDGGWRYWAVFAISAAALVYDQYFGALQIGAQFLAFGVFIWTRRGVAGGRSLLWRCMASAALFMLLIAPLAPYAHQQFSQTLAAHSFNGVVATAGNSINVYSTLTVINWALWGYHSNSAMADLNALWPGFMLVSLLLLGKRLDWRTRLVAWCVAVPVLGLFAIGLRQPNLFDVRYIAGIVPLLIVLAAILISHTTRQPTTTVAFSGLLAVVFVIALVNQQYSPTNPRLFDYQHTVGWVDHRYRPGDLVEYGPDGQGSVISYYGPKLSAQLVAANARAADAKRIFLIIAPPLYNSSSTAEAVAIYDAGRGRKLIARYQRANVKVWEFG